MRRAARRDANHALIRDALRHLGYTVADTASLGNGFPDLVAHDGHHVLLVEVKDPDKPASARKLTRDERAFVAAWAPFAIVVHYTDEVIRAFEALQQQRGPGSDPEAAR
jgi:Holliday junction resolvase